MNNARSFTAGIMVPAFTFIVAGAAADVSFAQDKAKDAQSNYPEKPIHFIVGFPPGSAPDIAARLLGPSLAVHLGQPVLVENVLGAAGNIAADRVAKADPDGYTLFLAANAQITVNPSLYKLPYDPVKDFAPISQVYVSSSVLVVNPSVPAKTLQELVALARAQPGGLTYATGGAGSAPHIAGELFKSVASVDIRTVPYKGTVLAMPDLLAGRVTMAFNPIVAVLSVVRDGKLRALAVTSVKRSPLLPEVPTIAEAGFPGYEATLWGGLLAPAGTAPAVIRKLHLETSNALARADVRGKLAAVALDAVGNSPDEFAAIIKSEIPKWAKLIKDSGITVQ